MWKIIATGDSFTDGDVLSCLLSPRTRRVGEGDNMTKAWGTHLYKGQVDYTPEMAKRSWSESQHPLPHPYFSS